MSIYIHESAWVDEGAIIGDGTKIWHFAHIMSTAQIGQECTLGQNVFVGSNVTIGNYVKIQNNVSVYEGVTLEDYVFCGPSAVFTNVTTPRSAFPVDSTATYKKTLVKQGASIGANATIVCGTTLGEWCFIGAGAVITTNVPAYALMVGVPARRIGWICRCGTQLTFDDQMAVCSNCMRRYKQLDPDSIALVDLP